MNICTLLEFVSAIINGIASILSLAKAILSRAWQIQPCATSPQAALVLATPPHPPLKNVHTSIVLAFNSFNLRVAS